MADLRTVDLTHFKELHLLPRVIFTLGGISFVGSFFVHSLVIAIIALAAIFLGVGFNLAIDTTRTLKKSWKEWWWWGFAQVIICAAIVTLLLVVAVHDYQNLLKLSQSIMAKPAH